MGERPTKYFFNLEKRNYIKKTITKLRMEDETVIKKETQILDAIENYFSNLYLSTDSTTQEDYDEYIQDLSLPRLSDEERDNMEGVLTYEECKKVLETFQNDKSPGEDGFTVEFYKFFFDLLGHDLIASFNEAYEANELTISQRRGVITLIPKEDGSLLDLSNWRPITLLNVDCKIATKAIAKRLEASLPKLINHDQTGFIKGRHIGENIRLIIDVMEYTKAHDIPGILVSLDFRKAFDSLEWPFIMRTLDTFNFGTSIKKWVCTFYTNIESAALNNGFLTKWFRPSRGIRQGCPLSPYLFILSAEIMANKVRQEPGFNGIKILGKELKLSQYADDTNLFCADLASVEKILEIVENFGNMAGLKLNRRKTKAIWLGRWEKNKSNPLQLKWLHNPVKILGIYVSYDENGNKQMNFNLKLQKLQTNLDMWRARDLTLFGRVLIIKSLGLSQLVYSASNLTVPQEITPIIKTKLFNFLWKNKRDKIKRAGLYQDRGKGGICMTDVETMIKALRLAWIPRLLTPEIINCKETKLKEFQFKLIHRIVVTKKELHRYGIKADDECLYCGEKDSIEHTFLNCQFVKIFVNSVIDWFNAANNSKFAPTIEEKLFGIISGPYEKEILKKFNYTILFMKYYIYTSKMHNQAIHLSVFVDKVLFKYRIEKFDC